jgi:GrpB-like predicted nucleotidyltransferase (UPF0157 family)
MRPIRVIDYDPAWPAIFEAAKSELLALLADRILGVDHIGSTSVPGLAAKPKIDLDVVLFADSAIDEATALVRARDFVFHGDPHGARRWAFTRDHEGYGLRVYLCGPDNPAHDDRIVFRDYLRSHPERANAYACLKRQLAAEAKDDWGLYTGSKTEFVAETLRLAAVGC